MKLILSRHGNTFGPGDPVVWTGSANDLPLVEKGLAQAEALAQALLKQGVRLQAIYCSPLQRTVRYARVVVERLALPFEPVVDPRINEVDYGEWTGLTNDEVRSRFGESALRGWDERSEWPADGDWGGSAAAVTADVQAFVRDLARRHGAEDTVLVVTSNGRLRYFLTLVPGELERRVADGSFKVKTGHVCGLELGRDGAARVGYWNAEPASTRL